MALSGKTKERMFGVTLLATALYANIALTARSWNPLPSIFGETRTGVYEGRCVEATKQMSVRKIMFYSIDGESARNGLERVIGIDYPGGDAWDSTEFLYVSKNSNLRDLATPTHYRKAWETLWSKKTDE